MTTAATIEDIIEVCRRLNHLEIGKSINVGDAQFTERLREEFVRLLEEKAKEKEKEREEEERVRRN